MWSLFQLPLLKDGNMFLSFHVDDPLIHRKFLGMMAADAAFLGTSNIMDYSLLLGIAFHTPRDFGNANSQAADVSGWSSPFRTDSNAACWSHRLNCWAGIEVREHMLLLNGLLTFASACLWQMNALTVVVVLLCPGPSRPHELRSTRAVARYF